MKKIADLKDDDVEWIVNDMSELGVKIGNKVFFLYKGNSYSGGDQQESWDGTKEVLELTVQMGQTF